MLPINAQRSSRCPLSLLHEDTVQPNGLTTDRQSERRTTDSRHALDGFGRAPRIVQYWLFLGWSACRVKRTDLIDKWSAGLRTAYLLLTLGCQFPKCAGD